MMRQGPAGTVLEVGGSGARAAMALAREAQLTFASMGELMGASMGGISRSLVMDMAWPVMPAMS